MSKEPRAYSRGKLTKVLYLEIPSTAESRFEAPNEKLQSPSPVLLAHQQQQEYTVPLWAQAWNWRLQSGDTQCPRVKALGVLIFLGTSISALSPQWKASLPQRASISFIAPYPEMQATSPGMAKYLRKAANTKDRNQNKQKNRNPEETETMPWKGEKRCLTITWMCWK